MRDRQRGRERARGGERERERDGEADAKQMYTCIGRDKRRKMKILQQRVREVSGVKDSQTLTGVQLSVIPVEATVPILFCQDYVASASKDTLFVTWCKNTQTQTSSHIQYRHRHIHGYTISLAHKTHRSNILTDLPHKKHTSTSMHASATVHIS